MPVDVDLPPILLKPVAQADGYGLVRLDDAGQLVRVATVHNQADPALTQAYLHCFRAALLLFDALDRQVDELQPDGWDEASIGEEGAAIWRASIRAIAYARGIPERDIPYHLREPWTQHG